MRDIRVKYLPNKDKWIDKDIEMLYVCFQLLEDYVEEERGLEHCSVEARKDFIEEAKALYDWWQGRKGWYSANVGDDKYYPDVYYATIEEDIEDDEMLIRLMKIRSYLWT